MEQNGSLEPPEEAGAAAQRTGLRESLSLLQRNRDFRNLYIAQIISFGGDWFLTIALFGLVLELTGSAITVALTLVAQEIPFFIFSPLGGALADRIDRRKLMVFADAMRAFLCLGFLFVRDLETLWIAFILLAIISSFSAVFDPASAAAVPNLVEGEDLAAANSLVGSAWGTMLAVGAALGGIVAATAGRDAAFLVDAISFAISALLLARIARPFAEARVEEHPSVFEATREVVHYAGDDHRVIAFLSVKAGFGLAAGVIVLISVFATEVFGKGDVGIGMLMAARGLGALIGPFIGRWMAGPDDRKLLPVIGLALLTFGVSYAALGFAPSILIAAPIVMFAHFGGGAQWALSTYGLQKIVPDYIRGRVFAVDFALITLTITISSVVAGWSAEKFGPRPTAVGLGVAAVLWAITWWLSTGKVRRRGI